jgi:hypothetical protein
MPTWQLSPADCRRHRPHPATHRTPLCCQADLTSWQQHQAPDVAAHRCAPSPHSRHQLSAGCYWCLPSQQASAVSWLLLLPALTAGVSCQLAAAGACHHSSRQLSAGCCWCLPSQQVSAVSWLLLVPAITAAVSAAASKGRLTVPGVRWAQSAFATTGVCRQVE